jgi:RNA polymerase sigma-70 factor (ECF subfamily)
MLFLNARREARLDPPGDRVILEEPDRGRWDRGQTAEVLPLVGEAFRGGPGPFALEAAISAEHCRAARFEDADRPRILHFYNLLDRVQPSPIVSLNRAVAVAMVEVRNPRLCWSMRSSLPGELDGYHLLYAARADLLCR